MSFLPIVERELRVAARNKVTWRTRFLAVLGALVVFIWIWGSMGPYSTPPQISKSLFFGMAWLAFVYVLFVGAFTTADSVSEEVREGTLGLLFLTDLKSMDILLGKMVAASLHAFYGLLAIFPIMTIPLLMGGLEWQDMAKAALVLVNTLFLSLSAGMMVSVFGREERRVTGAAFGLLLFLAGGLPLIVGLGIGLIEENYPGWNSDTFSLLFIPSPGTAMAFALFGEGGFAWPDAFWWSVGLNHLMAWICLWVASRRLRNAWKDKPATARSLNRRERWRQWCYGSGEERARYRRRLMDVNPFLWLNSRDRLKPWWVWLFLGLVAALWLWTFLRSSEDIGKAWVGIMFCYPAHLTLKLWLVSEACARFGQDRQSGALELILATPSRLEDILAGQWRSLHRQFLWPNVFLLGVEFYYLLADRTESYWVATVGTYMGTCVLDYWACGWVGLWLGLNARKQSIAARGTVARVLALPWMMWFGLILLGEFGHSNSGEGVLAVWAMLSGGCALSFGLIAWTKLHHNFREVASKKFAAR